MSHWIFTEEHEQFRQSVRKFVEKEMIPHIEKWEKDGGVPANCLKEWETWAI